MSWRNTTVPLAAKTGLPTFDSAVAGVQASTQPVEVIGPLGTVVFWHQRMVHTAGINTRKTVRHATLCDFKNERFLSAADCATSDLWETWSPRVRQLASVREESEEPEPDNYRAAARESI